MRCVGTLSDITILSVELSILLSHPVRFHAIHAERSMQFTNLLHPRLETLHHDVLRIEPDAHFVLSGLLELGRLSLCVLSWA